MNITTNNADINITAGTTKNINFAGSGSVNVSAAQSFNLIPAGTILTTVTSTVPTGYLHCNGQIVSQAAYPRLWAAIGTTFGSSAGNVVCPAFQGSFLRGAGSQTVGGVTYAANAVGSAQQDQVLAAGYATNEGFRSCAAGARDCVARYQITTDPVDSTGIVAQFARQGTENRPMNYSVYYYIRY